MVTTVAVGYGLGVPRRDLRQRPSDGIHWRCEHHAGSAPSRSPRSCAPVRLRGRLTAPAGRYLRQVDTSGRRDQIPSPGTLAGDRHEADHFVDIEHVAVLLGVEGDDRWMPRRDSSDTSEVCHFQQLVEPTRPPLARCSTTTTARRRGLRRALRSSDSTTTGSATRLAGSTCSKRQPRRDRNPVSERATEPVPVGGVNCSPFIGEIGV